MGRRKTAIKKSDQETRKPSRRWLLIHNETGQEIGGTNPSKHADKATWGISDFDQACDKASRLVASVTVVPAWEFYGVDDPEPDDD
jgi:hypothetical protein